MFGASVLLLSFLVVPPRPLVSPAVAAPQVAPKEPQRVRSPSPSPLSPLPVDGGSAGRSAGSSASRSASRSGSRSRSSSSGGGSGSQRSGGGSGGSRDTRSPHLARKLTLEIPSTPPAGLASPALISPRSAISVTNALAPAMAAASATASLLAGFRVVSKVQLAARCGGLANCVHNQHPRCLDRRL